MYSVQFYLHLYGSRFRDIHFCTPFGELLTCPQSSTITFFLSSYSWQGNCCKFFILFYFILLLGASFIFNSQAFRNQTSDSCHKLLPPFLNCCRRDNLKMAGVFKYDLGIKYCEETSKETVMRQLVSKRHLMNIVLQVVTICIAYCEYF